MSMPGCAAIAAPTTRCRCHVTRLNTPAGRPTSWMISARMNALSGATSLGLSTIVQPAASAPPTLQMIWCSGIVPRRDGADDADGLLHDEAVADLFFELERVEQRGERLHVAGGEAGLDHRRPGDRHADLAGDHLGDLGRTSLERLVQTDEVLLALLDRRLRPAVERGTGRGDRACRRRRRCRRESSPSPARCRR